MAGEIRKFKRSVLGGFDCNEVVEYIGRISSQRNEYKAAGEKIGAELEETKAELEELKMELTSAAGELEEISRATALELDKANRACKALEEERTAAVKARDEALKARDDAVKEQDAARLKAVENTQRAVNSVRNELEAEKQRYEKEIVELEKRRSDELAELKKSHRNEVSRLREEYERKLNEREAALKQELEAERQRVKAIRDAGLNNAANTIKELETIYGGVQKTLGEASGTLNQQIEKVHSELAVMTSALDRTGKCITSLYDAVEKSKAEINRELNEIEPENV